MSGRLQPESDGGVIESDDGGALVLEMPWNRLPAVVFLILPVGIVAGALNSHQPVMVPVAAVLAVAALYTALAHAVNWTTISADDSSLDVSVGPIPWIGGGGIATREIVGFDIEKTVHHDRHHVDHGTAFVLGVDRHRNDRFTYTLTASLRDGSDWTVTRGWSSRAPLAWVQWRLRERLGVS